MKYVAFDMEDELHKSAKILAITLGVTLKEYLISLITKDIENRKEQ